MSNLECGENDDDDDEDHQGVHDVDPEPVAFFHGLVLLFTFFGAEGLLGGDCFAADLTVGVLGDLIHRCSGGDVACGYRNSLCFSGASLMLLGGGVRRGSCR